MKNSLISFLFLFGAFVPICNQVPRSEINARLLQSRIVNYQYGKYPLESPWLEYFIEIENNGPTPVCFCPEDGLLILNSKGGDLSDTLHVFIGGGILYPEEIDTIRIVDYLVEKEIGFKRIHWVKPNEMRLSCSIEKGSPDENTSVTWSKCVGEDEAVIIESFLIKRSDNFLFSIE